MECVVCYEPTESKRNCGHYLCHSCLFQWSRKLKRCECPYCRQALVPKPMELYFDVKISFRHFLYLFYHSIYRNNVIVNMLKKNTDSDSIEIEGKTIELRSIFHSDYLYWVEHIDDFDSKGVTLRIFEYKTWFSANTLRSEICFQTLGIDVSEKIHSFRFVHRSVKGITLINYLDKIPQDY